MGLIYGVVLVTGVRSVACCMHCGCSVELRAFYEP